MLQQYNSYDLFFREKKKIKRENKKREERARKYSKVLSFIMYD